MVKMIEKYNKAIEEINKIASVENSESDKLLGWELKKAKKFLEDNFNKYAEEGDVKNSQILKQFYVLEKQAYEHAKERDSAANEKTMNAVHNILRREKSK